VDVREPAERPDPREYEVEPLGSEHVESRVHLRLDELHVALGLLGERSGLGQRRRREVEARHAGAEPSERDRVRADVALQVHALEAGDVAEQRQVEAHDVAEMAGIGPELLERVVE
jgi:hypothetical protein